MTNKTLKYEAGTIAVSNGSVIVTGSGTSWKTYVEPGWKLQVGGVGDLYTVDSIEDNNALTLTAPYIGATQPAAQYAAINVAAIFTLITHSQDKTEIAANGVEAISFTGLPGRTSVYHLKPNGAYYRTVVDGAWSTTATIAGLNLVAFSAPGSTFGFAVFMSI